MSSTEPRTPRTPPRDVHRPLLIGLTGGIGAGKSAALEAFARHGAATLSSDAVVHHLYTRAAVRDAVVELLGPGVLDERGEIDRARVAAQVFGHPDRLRALEGLMHPLVAAELLRWRDEHAGTAPLLVHEVPLLFEAGLEDRYDRVVVITAPDELRRERAPEWERRSAHQLPEDEKRRRADDVYVNAGSLADLDAWVAALVRRLAR
jgi:dephospho-CoA kinase